jgi:hypothetical protein
MPHDSYGTRNYSVEYYEYTDLSLLLSLGETVDVVSPLAVLFVLPS